MKTKIGVLFAIMFMAIFSSVVNVQAMAEPSNMPPIPITMQLVPDYIPEPDEEGQRSPSRPIYCTISSEGIDIPGVASEDIYLYEVYSEDGVCMATFASESGFISYIYESEETVEIRLHIDMFVLRGFLYR